MVLDDYFWVEKYRPRKVSECILPSNVKEAFQAFVDQGKMPNLILSGSPGTGKTTIARAMCEEIKADYILINGSVENGIDTIRMKITNYASSVSFTGGRKVIIMDEADNLTPDAQKAFRGVIEEFAGNCSFIFTCNYIRRIIEALYSRCAIIDFKLKPADKAQMAAAFYKRIVDILKNENIEYDKAVIGELISKYFPDYRRTLNELQRHSRNGKVEAGVLSQLSDENVDELVGFLKGKEFKSIRKWVGTNSDIDTPVIIRALYDRMVDVFKPQTLPDLILLASKYQYQAAFCADQEINLMAFLMEVMLNCEVK